MAPGTTQPLRLAPFGPMPCGREWKSPPSKDVAAWGQCLLLLLVTVVLRTIPNSILTRLAATRTSTQHTQIAAILSPSRRSIALEMSHTTQALAQIFLSLLRRSFQQ